MTRRWGIRLAAATLAAAVLVSACGAPASPPQPPVGPLQDDPTEPAVSPTPGR